SGRQEGGDEVSDRTAQSVRRWSNHGRPGRNRARTHVAQRRRAGRGTRLLAQGRSARGDPAAAFRLTSAARSRIVPPCTVSFSTAGAARQIPTPKAASAVAPQPARCKSGGGSGAGSGARSTGN